MAGKTLPPRYLKAGEEYLDALRSLGLTPQFLGWGWDTMTNVWVLVMFTSIVDAGGPLALNELLFAAYNAKATPREISPFIVRVFSPEIMPRNFWALSAKEVTIKALKDARITSKVENYNYTFLGIELERINCYHGLPTKGVKYHDRRKDWDRFKRNIARLAA